MRGEPRSAAHARAGRAERAGSVGRERAAGARVVVAAWGLLSISIGPCGTVDVAATRVASDPLPLAVGLGGGGAMYQPVVSPHDPRDVIVASDMSGIFRSRNGGATYTLVDQHELRSVVCDDCPPSAVTFDPDDPATLYMFGEGRDGLGVYVSRDFGDHFSLWTREPPWIEAGAESGADGTPATVTRFVFDPCTKGRVIAGTDRGLFVSSDRGEHFRLLVNDLSVREVLFAAPGEADAGGCVAYVASQDRVIVVQGDAVVEGGDGLPDAPIVALAIGGASPRAGAARGRASGGDPFGSPRIYVTTAARARDGRHEGGLFVSTDGARSFARADARGVPRVIAGANASDEIDDVTQIVHVAADQRDAFRVWITTRPTGRRPPFDANVFRSDDGGESFRPTVFPRPPSVVERLAARAKGLFGVSEPPPRAQNVAHGWMSYGFGWEWGGAAKGFSIAPTDRDLAIFTNLGEVFVTRDGGDRWTQAYTEALPQAGPVYRPAHHAYRSVGLEVTTAWNVIADPHAPARRFIAYTDIGLARSEDHGQSFRPSLRGSPWASNVYGLAFDPEIAGRVLAAVARQHDIPHWTQLHGKKAGRAGTGGVVRSDNGGASWSVVGRGLPDAPTTAIVLDPTSPKGARRVFVAQWGHGVFRSDDGGDHFAPAGSGIPEGALTFRLRRHPSGALFALASGRRIASPEPREATGETAREMTLDASPVTTMTRGGLYRSDDDGRSWRPLTADERIPLYWARDVAVDPDDDRHLVLAVADVLHDPHGRVGGLFRSRDSGATWSRLAFAPRDVGGRFEPFGVIFESWRADAPRRVYVTTTGQGTWFSDDGGARFYELPVPFLSTHAVDPDPTDERALYVTTFGGGVFRVARPERR